MLELRPTSCNCLPPVCLQLDHKALRFGALNALIWTSVALNIFVILLATYLSFQVWLLAQLVPGLLPSTCTHQCGAYLLHGAHQLAGGGLGGARHIKTRHCRNWSGRLSCH